MKLPFAQGKHYGILGLGKSGRSALASLIASGAHVTAWDDGETSRATAQKENPSLEITPPAEWNWPQIGALIISPGIPHTHAVAALAHHHNVEIIGDIELLARANPNANYIAITGTNGKSTTTTLIGHILKACKKRVEIGGNLGTPALDLQPLDANGTYVLELSSYQLESVKTLRANIAVWLNVTPDHLDHHGSMDAYISAKQHIFDRQQASDVAVIGIDDAISESMCRSMIARKLQRVIPISGRQKITDGIFVQNGRLTNTIINKTGDLRAIKSLQGEHNGQNAAAAYAACFAQGCEHDAMIAAMQTYEGLPHRMQWLGETNGVQFINDSKATNADATEKSLRTYDNIFWIAGGVAKEGGIEPLASYFSKIRHAYLIGEAADTFAKTLGGKVAFTQCGTLEKAFHAAVADAAKNKTQPKAIILAPACASFDQFANFEKRGDAFMQLLREYRAKIGGTHAASA